MSIEKEIKRQARASLRGNMSKLIAGAGLTMLVLLLLEYTEYLFFYATGVMNWETGAVADTDIPAFYIVTGIFLAAALLASPVLNGFLRMAVQTSVKKECRSLDVFYYFTDSARFVKTVFINLLLLFLVGAASAVLNISGWLQLVSPEWFDAAPGLTPERILTVFTGMITWLLRVLVFMLLAHYPLLSYAFDETQSVKHCVFDTLQFSFRHFWQLLRLAFSFTGWFALCFFVVPALYVLPYYTVAAADSARWLFRMENGGEVL